MKFISPPLRVTFLPLRWFSRLNYFNTYKIYKISRK